MDLLHIAVLAIIQGITAFLPVGPDAHSALMRTLFGWQIPNLSVRLGIDAGLLLAAAAYLYREMGQMAVGLFHVTVGRRTPQARLTLNALLAALPLIAASAIALVFTYTGFGQSPQWAAWGLIVFGVLLWLADRLGMTLRRMDHLTAGTALTIGFAQVLSLIAGAGRTTMAIGAARLFGFERAETARFAVLLGVPMLLAVCGYDIYRVVHAGDAPDVTGGIIGGALAFAAALAAITAMMQWLERHTFAVFALYRVLLGAAVLAWLYYGRGAA